MKRRGFITLLGGAAAWPLTVRAQQPDRVRRIGMLIGFAKDNPLALKYVTAFVQGLQRFGWSDGKNIRIDYRFAAGDPSLFKNYAAELTGSAPDAIVASTAPALVALRARTRTIPLVFVIVPDPVSLGFVQSLARPGGNITGFSSYDASIVGKWLQLLKQVAPGIKGVAVIFNPETAFAPPLTHEIGAARSLGVTMTLAPVQDDAAIEEAIATQAREPGGGLIIMPDSFNVTHREVIIAAATRHGLPLIGWMSPRTGELMSYWYDTIDLHAQAASYIDRILRGANPAELPVQYPTKYSLVINLTTAKALGLSVPPAILSIADELIE